MATNDVERLVRDNDTEAMVDNLVHTVNCVLDMLERAESRIKKLEERTEGNALIRDEMEQRIEAFEATLAKRDDAHNALCNVQYGILADLLGVGIVDDARGRGIGLSSLPTISSPVYGVRWHTHLGRINKARINERPVGDPDTADVPTQQHVDDAKREPSILSQEQIKKMQEVDSERLDNLLRAEKAEAELAGRCDDETLLQRNKELCAIIQEADTMLINAIHGYVERNEHPTSNMGERVKELVADRDALKAELKRMETAQATISEIHHKDIASYKAEVARLRAQKKDVTNAMDISDDQLQDITDMINGKEAEDEPQDSADANGEQTQGNKSHKSNTVSRDTDSDGIDAKLSALRERWLQAYDATPSGAGFDDRLWKKLDVILRPIFEEYEAKVARLCEGVKVLRDKFYQFENDSMTAKDHARIVSEIKSLFAKLDARYNYAMREKAETQVARLRNALENAPHRTTCNSITGHECNCWKKYALESEGNE